MAELCGERGDERDASGWECTDVAERGWGQCGCEVEGLWDGKC